MELKSKFDRKLGFVSKKDDSLKFQSKYTPLVEKKSEFARVMIFQSKWITEGMEA